MRLGVEYILPRYDCGTHSTLEQSCPHVAHDLPHPRSTETTLSRERSDGAVLGRFILFMALSVRLTSTVFRGPYEP